MAEVEQKRKRVFKTYSYRGVQLEQLLTMTTEEFVKIAPARVRRRFANKKQTISERVFLEKLIKAKKECVENEKPVPVKTHLRNVIVVPEMINGVVGVYNGKVFNNVEIKPEMLGHYLGEFSITYTPVRHGRAGATTSRFIPLR
ncbi:hypothetical protein QEN19_000574 [Hanseniaspora menglaensis]